MNKLLGLGLVSSLAVGCAGAAVQRPVTSAPAALCAGRTVHGDAQLEPYRECAEVSGDLEVRDVCSLSALAGVHKVSGTLSIAHNEGLDSLDGLEQLQAVSALELRDNPRLVDVSQVSQLRIAHQVVIEGNARLRNVQGLSGLTQIDRLSLSHNGFYSLRGLENLREVSVLQVVDNPFLIDAGSLNQVNRAHSVIIERNPRLCGWFGLLRGLTQTDRVAISGNLGLDKATLLRFDNQTTQISIAAR